jgi:hypothetical protein
LHHHRRFDAMTTRVCLRFARIGLTTVAMLGLVLMAAEPASAAGATKLRVAAVPKLRATNVRYPFAGYITPPATVTSASTTVVLPAVACTKKIAAFAAGAIVYDSSAGTFSGAMVYIGCSSKEQQLTALVEDDNTYTTPTVVLHSGDTVDLSVTCGSSGISVSVDDQTTVSTGTGSSATAETCTQGEVGDDAAAFSNDSIAPLPPFVSVNFTNAMVNAAAIGLLDPTTATYFEGKKNQIATGALTDGGTAFTTTKG